MKRYLKRMLCLMLVGSCLLLAAVRPESVNFRRGLR